MWEEHLKIYAELVGDNPNFNLKGKTVPYTSANGYMFSQLNKKGELGIRLSKMDTQEFDSNFGAKPFISYGATMREYVLVPEPLLQDRTTLGVYLQKAYQYVMTLPPK